MQPLQETSQFACISRSQSITAKQNFAVLYKLVIGEFNIRSPYFKGSSGRTSEYFMSWELWSRENVFLPKGRLFIILF